MQSRPSFVRVIDIHEAYQEEPDEHLQLDYYRQWGFDLILFFFSKRIESVTLEEVGASWVDNLK